MTLQCVPAFLLHAREEPMALPEVLGGIDDLVTGNDHFEFYWFPHTEKALIKRNNRVPQGTERKPVGRFRHWLDDEFLSNTALRASTGSSPANATGYPGSQHRRVDSERREYVDDSYNVFVSPRTVRFRESEFAMPREALGDVLGELKKWFDAGHETSRSRLRCASPPPTTYGCPQVTSATTSTSPCINTYAATTRRTLPRPKTSFTAHEGRPHWGKIHTLDSSYFAQRYAWFNDFVAIRDQLDPKRTFSNEYLDRVLG